MPLFDSPVDELALRDELQRKIAAGEPVFLDGAFLRHTGQMLSALADPENPDCEYGLLALGIESFLDWMHDIERRDIAEAEEAELLRQRLEGAGLAAPSAPGRILDIAGRPL